MEFLKFKGLVRKYPVLGSSENLNELSLTIKSLGIALIPVFIAIGRMAGLEIVEADLVQLINVVASVASGIMFIIGMLRKYINAK